ncbi:hypothetical protein MYOV003v1_p0138 [Vibrio phage 207E48.1]|nr:hypothetical protein MYOV003v1_p0138 [Vibrio phage 207E48.1]
MPFSVAPSVQYTERDASLFTKAAVTVAAGFSGVAPWGEANAPVRITGGEQTLVNKFFKPSNDTYRDFFVAADYMRYASVIYYNRLVGPKAKNAVDGSNSAMLVENRNAFDTATFPTAMKFIGRYAGALGNSIAVAIADKDTFADWDFKDNFQYTPEANEYAVCVVDTTGLITGGAAAHGQINRFQVKADYIPTVDGVKLSGLTPSSTEVELATKLANAYPVGSNETYSSATAVGGTVELVRTADGVHDEITPVVHGAPSLSAAGSIKTTGGPSIHQIDVITLTGSLDASMDMTVDGVTVTVPLNSNIKAIEGRIATALSADAKYASAFAGLSGVVATMADNTVKVDPTTIVVTDPTNVIGVTVSKKSDRLLGTVIPDEIYELVQTDPESETSDGASAYFVEIINESSSWVYTTTEELSAGWIPLSGGVDDYDVDRVSGFNEYKNAVSYAISAVVDSSGEVAAQQAAIDVCIKRRDAVAFISPPMSSVVNRRGRETDLIEDWSLNQVLRDSSYFFQDDNWGYVWDKYNKKWRWIPCAGGTAGLRARTHSLFGPWKSFAFHNRGKYSGYRRTAWSADDDQRLVLYKAKVNSISTIPGGGIVLMGDKTGLSRPSAFDRCNVRDTFIMMEQNISGMAKYFLGENNDEFTRGLFLNTVRPYIRNLEDQAAILQGKVKCDEDNNTGQVIASNTMKAGIWVKPQYSINWVFLDFAALRPDMSFDELEGAAGIAAAG